MTILIRRAALNSDREELIDLFRLYLNPGSDMRRFNWLYCSNPFGEAFTWVACDAQKGMIVGAGAAFPRRVYVNGNERLSLVLGDFCLQDEYRSLGPAIQLQRACFEGANKVSAAFCYDFPSASMMAIYRRMAIPQTGSLVRWARPLRADRKLAAFVKSKLLARGLAVGVNAVLSVRGRKQRKEFWDLSLHQGVCGEEFTVLDTKVRRCPGVFSVRTAEYLNWRYLSNPERTYEILAARYQGALLGYAVFTHERDNGNIVDLCSIGGPDAVASLLSGACDILGDRGVATVSLCAGDQHPWNAIFERAAFRRRERAPVVVYGTSPSQEIGFCTRNWFLMQGERES